jgi:hypothetical protein
MLRHFNLACGVLPDESSDQPLVSEEIPPPDFTGDMPLDNEYSVPVGDGQIAQIEPPVYDGGGVTPSFGGPPLNYPGSGGSGGGGGYIPPKTPPPNNPPPNNPPPDNPPPNNPPPDNPPPNNPPPDNPPPVVPEPSSYVLVLTGLAAAAGVVKRRFER